MLTQERISVSSVYYEAFEPKTAISPAFLEAWKGKSQAQFKEELASLSLETNRVPDPYHFIVDAEGDLFSPNARCKVRDSIITNNHVGRLEAQAFSRIEQFTRKNDQGVIAWISPPDPDVYPGLKIVISEIKKRGSEKLLFNRAILFDFNDSLSMKFAQSLAAFSVNRPSFETDDQVRSTPLILDTSDAHWTDILQNLVGMPELWESVRNEEDLKAKRQALTQAEEVYSRLFKAKDWSKDITIPRSKILDDAQRMMVAMLGINSSSCPKLFDTAFQVFSGNSQVFNATSYGYPASLKASLPETECSEIKCPKCGWKPTTKELDDITNGILKSCPGKDGRCGFTPG